MNRIWLVILLVIFYSPTLHAQTCGNWLFNPSVNSSVSIDDLNITGNVVTVEALINRTQPYLPGGGNGTEGDIVSKHNDFSDVNYLLRPNHAYITTTNGFFGTPDICDLKLNKTYHVALVYDGSTLKFYRDGALMSQVNATGNLIQNNWKTRIGWYEPSGFTTQFIGYTNEVRIWNVARTQAQLKANMTGSLPSPTTQTGLQAYYTFDNLLNKQGNAAYNGALIGGATINQTNPRCTLTVDSCATVTNTGASVVINDYTPVIAFDPCKNNIVVEDATRFNAGDTVLMIQMKGAEIDSANNASFGTVTNYKNAGNYEMNIVKSKAGNVVELKNSILKQYDVSLGRVQLIRVPYFQNYTVTDTLTCLPWDGRKGGVLVLNVAGTTTMNGDINVSARGFRGGSSKNSFSTTLTCGNNDFTYPNNTILAADKGESIYEIGTSIAYGKGANANGGGGGNGHNSGGGGGSNAGTGGFGGYQLEACGNAPFDNRGIGGKPLLYSNVNNKIFVGGGGGSGHTDNVGGIDMQGGNGGGIALILTGTLTNNGFKIISNGADAQACDNALNNCHDASGGGGSGGTILVKTNTYTNNTPVENKGGKGGNLVIYNPGIGAGRIGPGGGGGGGASWFSQGSTPANAIVNSAGGAAGVIPLDGNSNWGATAGAAGNKFFSLQVPVATIPFKPNIDSVKINTALTACATYDFKGLAFTNTNPIQNWNWYFGDNTTFSTQNVSHTFPSAGTYSVKLVVTDVNGCKDSTLISVNASSGPGADFTYKQNTCNPLSVQFFHSGAAPVNPVWLFGDGNTNTGTADPVNLYPAPGNYTVKYSVQNGTCTDTVTKVITIDIQNADVILTKDTTICFGAVKKLLTAPSLSFCWSPVTSLDDPLSATPTTNTTVPITYYFTAEIPGNNIITNGNFSGGNAGFTSGYNYAANNTTEGEYFVGNAPQSWNGGLSTCSDHTGANGNMLLVNGSPVADVTVWKQTVTVTPNTNYAFATWIQALFPPNPAQLSFSINGKDVGSPITAALPTCTWNRFFTTWNSGSSTTATIAIVNKNTFVQGNDFALDDISFSPVLIKRDSVKISIDKPLIKAGNDTLICETNSAQLNATGAATYSWLPAGGLNNASVSNPIATVSDTTQYVVTGTTAAGCKASDSLIIFTKQPPIIKTTNDTAICKGATLQFTTTGGTSYNWLPASGLSNTSIGNPVASPAATTKYIVLGTGVNGCTATDTVTLTINPLPLVKTIDDIAICLGNTLPVATSGAATYSWSPATGVSNTAIGNPTITPADTTQYIVKGTSAGGCVGFDTLNIYTRQLPVVKAGNDTIICASTTVQLVGSGTLMYSWSPDSSLNNGSVNNPIATPADTTTYVVIGYDQFGCRSKPDSVTVFTRPLPAITRSADTIVCKNAPVQLIATGGARYQWSPAAGLSNTGIANPTAIAATTTFFKVIVTAPNSCFVQDSVKITVKADPVFTISPSGNTCFNTSVQLSASGGNSYTWSPTSLVSNATSATPSTVGNATTVYSVIVKENTCNFTDTLTTTVTVFPLPPVKAAKSNDVDCALPNARLSASGASQYTWSPAATLSDNSGPNPLASPENNILYTVSGTEAATGCTASDTITVFVNKTGNASLFIPSAFSPNGDTRNECFKVTYQGRFTEFYMSIFNRYGELVFFTRNADECWDGTYKGKAQNTGNYVYIIKAKNLCREQFKKGNVLLIR